MYFKVLHVKMWSAPLRIETGRYENIALNDRICQLCDCGNVEDEIHFLMSCTLMGDPLICKFTTRAYHEKFRTRR